MSIRRVHLIINPATAPDRPILHIANRVFQRHGIDWDVTVTHTAGDATQRARAAALRSEVDLILCYGGDGTIRDVVNGLVGTEMPLGFLAGGTGNAMASELGISTFLEPALETICSGRGELRHMDVGQINGTYFLLRADTGLTTEVMAATTRDLKDRFGVLAYFFALARVMQNRPPRVNYTITIDGTLVRKAGAACIITNVSSVGTAGRSLGRSVKFDDGLFDVFVLDTDLRSVLSAASNSLDRLFHWQGREIHIQTDIPQPMGIDGDPYGETPFTVRVLPRAMRIFVPE